MSEVILPDNVSFKNIWIREREDRTKAGEIFTGFFSTSPIHYDPSPAGRLNGSNSRNATTHIRVTSQPKIFRAGEITYNIPWEWSLTNSKNNSDWKQFISVQQYIEFRMDGYAKVRKFNPPIETDRIAHGGKFTVTEAVDWKKTYRSRAVYGLDNRGTFIPSNIQDTSPGFTNSIKISYSGEAIEVDGKKSFVTVNGVPFPTGEKGGKVSVGDVVIQQFWIKPNETIEDVLKQGLENDRSVSSKGRTVMVLGSVVPFYEEDINIIDATPFTFSGPSVALGAVTLSSSGLALGPSVAMGPFKVKAGSITFPWPYNITDPQAPAPMWGNKLSDKNLMIGTFIAADGRTYKFAEGNYKRKYVALKHNPLFGQPIDPDVDPRVAFPHILVSDESVVEVDGTTYISPLFDYKEKQYFWSK